ncbi:dynein axonemal intermediate chain 4-like [Chaetodon trifascialis]|uniref:dynein axonemal intermediate chain 4-like n=1 Tax=Chaetodon trifascialis TaxID=109706 RepID=UPI003993294A
MRGIDRLRGASGYYGKGEHVFEQLERSSRATKNSVPGIHHISQSSRWSFRGLQSPITSISIKDCSHRKVNSQNGRAVKVLPNTGKDVTPLSLSDAEPGLMQSKPARLFLDEVFSNSGSDHSKSTSSFNVPSSSSSVGSSLPSSLLSKASPTKETEDSDPKLDIPINPPSPCEVQRKRDNMEQHVTEEMLDEVVDICLSETESISLLEIPNTFVSEDSDDAEAMRESNICYAELCKNRIGNDKYVVRSMQTFDGARKDKQTQTDKILMLDEGTISTIWDICDSFSDQNETPESEKDHHLGSTVNDRKGQETRGGESSSMSSTVSTGSSTGSLFEMEMCGDSFNAEPDPQLIMWSESFQQSLLIMERIIIANIFQPKLAAYRQLPILEDPDSTVKPGTEEQSKEGWGSSSFPTLEHLWAFSCELTRGCNITSMVWNKENPDILAVGYGDFDCSNRKPGLICCWSLKNPLWPERVFRCQNCVTSLDFSANNPGQLAVGMCDGTVAIYNVQSQNTACIASSSKSSEKLMGPVWQVNWTKEERGLSGEDELETLISVSADGRIARWLLYSDGLNYIDLMELSKAQNREKKAKRRKIRISIVPVVSPACWIDFHPTNSGIYLTGTWEGFIHKCSYSNSRYFLDTYKKHFCPVSHIEWSPFSSDVFLSCSSDWTIQLWKQDRSTPVLSFTSTQSAVDAVSWSPNWSTIFAAIKGQQVEIWDLNSSTIYPTIVYHTAPGVKVTSLLFARGTDCVLLGDSDGQVTVYQLRNLRVGEGKQVDSLDDIIHSAVSSQL